jgi:hypothetical protein
MSGPIIRKYGFPNFENIFGKRDLEHGAEETPAKADVPDPTPKPEVTSGKPNEPGTPKPSRKA